MHICVSSSFFISYFFLFSILFCQDIFFLTVWGWLLFLIPNSNKRKIHQCGWHCVWLTESPFPATSEWDLGSRVTFCVFPLNHLSTHPTHPPHPILTISSAQLQRRALSYRLEFCPNIFPLLFIFLSHSWAMGLYYWLEIEWEETQSPKHWCHTVGLDLELEL
jgi:hypothetical protein